MVNIHPTAIVNPNAKLGENVLVSPYAIIHDNTEIGDNCSIGPKAVIYPYTTLGSNVRISHSASIGHIPQDLKFKGEITTCKIGSNSVIHEFVTIHRGTIALGETSIGEEAFIMAYSHVAHDCTIKEKVTIANCAQIAGHVSIERNAVIGGFAKIRQFTRIGKFCMIQGGRGVAKDVPHYILAGEERLQFGGLNKIGLRRNGFSEDQINVIKKIYFYLYGSNLNVSQAKEKILAEFPTDPYSNEIVDFINQSKVGII
jgi:UDP-N-acetylglucosamine acyltransferase